MSVTVAYLARGIGSGVEGVQAFLASYAAHPAGAPHRLILMVKGWDGVSGREKVDHLASDANAGVLELPDDGFDWCAYFRMADRVETEFLFLLNSHSRILRDNWLARLLAQATRPGVGLVGCTGSWGTRGTSWQFCYQQVLDRLQTGRWFRALGVVVWSAARHLQILCLYHWRFPPFPNPHVRSNAFMMRTDLLRAFGRRQPLPATKHDAYDLESGRHSLTRFVIGRGLAALVCDADGVGYGPDDWPRAGVFCTPGQPGLLISDNQTRAYDAAPVRHRRDLEALVWGRFMTDRSP